MQYFRNILKERPEISIRYDREYEAVWCYFDPKERPRYSTDIIESGKAAQQAVIDYFEHSRVKERFPIKYWVYASTTKDIYNYGGDLAYFADLIEKRDREHLLAYARGCIDIVYLNATNFGLPLTTITLVQGDALGGGFELALSNSVVIAEERSRMGFPEIRFNLFPGMGAYSLLARYHGIRIAEEMMSSGKIYTAKELYKNGIITEVVEDGTGVESVKRFIKRHRKFSNGMQGIQKVEQRYRPLSYEELMDITEIWVDTALKLTENDLRTMRRLVQAQNMKKIRYNRIRTYQDRRVIPYLDFPLVDSNGVKVFSDRRSGRDRRLAS